MNNDKKSVLPLAVCITTDSSFKIACSTDVSYLLFSLYKTGVGEALIENLSFSGLPEAEYIFYFAFTNAGESRIKFSVIKGQVDMNEIDDERVKKEFFSSNWVIGSSSYAK